MNLISVAVDIFHISAAHPRFAFVAYTDPSSGLAAITELHSRPITLDDDFARQHASDLQVWRAWSGSLVVVPAEPSRLVPRSVLSLFPALPDWAHGTAKDGMDGDLGEANELLEVQQTKRVGFRKWGGGSQKTGTSRSDRWRSRIVSRGKG